MGYFKRLQGCNEIAKRLINWRLCESLLQRELNTARVTLKVSFQQEINVFLDTACRFCPVDNFRITSRISNNATAVNFWKNFECILQTVLTASLPVPAIRSTPARLHSRLTENV